MSLRIHSFGAPFETAEAAQQAAIALRRMEAMGLTSLGDIESLDGAAFADALGPAEDLDIGRELAHELRTRTYDQSRLLAVFRTFNEALLDSPVPEHEWPAMLEVLDLELLSKLMNTSASSVRRYRSGERPTPDDIGARLHFLALICSDLGGAYNSRGIRRWFVRPRKLLNGKSPQDLLVDDWDPEDENPRSVRALAAGLTAPFAA